MTTVGKKVVVAVTGLVLYGFVIGHLIGNLQVFGGPDLINDYAKFLREAGPLLWGTRAVLLLSVVLHAVFTIQLTRLNHASRPVGYAEHRAVRASLPSRVMIWSGLFLGFYIVYHILHLTTGTAHPAFDPTDVYGNMVRGFSSPAAAGVYVLAMVALGFHLHHGVYSVFQTLGLNHPRWNKWRRVLSVGSAYLIAAGYISIPAAVLLGILK